MKVYTIDYPYEDRSDPDFIQELIELADVTFEANKSEINEFIDLLIP